MKNRLRKEHRPYVSPSVRDASKRRKQQQRNRAMLRSLKPASFETFQQLEILAYEQVEYNRLLDQLRREEMI